MAGRDLMWTRPADLNEMTTRLYCAQPIAGASVALSPEVAHHALRVLRLRRGDEVILFDGRGGEWPGVLADTAGAAVVVLDAWRQVERELPLQVTLAQALLVNEKMDWVLQKSVELGVAGWQPLSTKRSVVRLSDERAEKRSRHWQQVAVAACEQCGRNRLPQLAAVSTLPDYLVRPAPSAATRLLLSPHGGVRLTSLARPVGPLTLLIGPEGGLEDSEELAACQAGFQPVTLGPRVLRTETAGMAALAAILALWGDF